MTAPLAGIRLVDLTMVWAGPFGTRLLGDYGAEVIKVESPRAWDLLRALGMIPRDVPRWYNQSAYFNHNNRSKYGVALDLRSDRGRDLLLKLCAVSDVIVENFRTDVMDNLGLSYEAVRAVNP
ncbi:MAG: CoA transferase, partial [Tepidiformaceae bacterium]